MSLRLRCDIQTLEDYIAKYNQSKEEAKKIQEALRKRKKVAYRERVLGAILQCPPFDCGTLSPYDYHVEEGDEYVDDPNAAKAVAEALETIRNIGGVGRGPELVALYTTGDGHCLVHAVSRALIGAELYYRYVHAVGICLSVGEGTKMCECVNV